MINERKSRKRHYYIYKITFLKGDPINRYYIGKRTFFGTTIEDDTYAGSGCFCFAYYKKYGKILGETYTKEILEINASQELNTQREAYWVGTKYADDKLCMNLVAGGFGCADHEILCYVQDQYKKDINQYTLDGKYIKTWHGIREAARELKINRQGINSVLKGRKPSAFGYIWAYSNGDIEDIAPINRKNQTAVNQYDLNGNFIKRYTSAKEALDALNYKGVHHDLIGKSCRRKVNHKIAHGFFWRFDGDTVTKEDLQSRIDAKEYQKQAIIASNSKPVAQYTKDGELIKIHKSIQEAARCLNISATSIGAICNGSNPNRHTAGGYKWRFADD